jgi:hypothetical protein
MFEIGLGVIAVVFVAVVVWVCYEQHKLQMMGMEIERLIMEDTFRHLREKAEKENKDGI